MLMNISPDDRAGRPDFAIINTWSDLLSCRCHLRDRAEWVRSTIPEPLSTANEARMGFWVAFSETDGNSCPVSSSEHFPGPSCPRRAQVSF